MKYFISETVLYFDLRIMDKYQDVILQLLKENFEFKSDDFDNFILVLQFTPRDRIGKFGPDRLQVSKKERTLFLGVNLANEIFKPSDKMVQSEVEYLSTRILEVKEENSSRLVKYGLITSAC